MDRRTTQLLEIVMRRSTITVGLLTSIIGAGLFHLKYEVMSLESQYKNICHSIRSTEESISILKAEWAHLTSPERLQQLSQKHLSIAPVTQKQMVSFRHSPASTIARAQIKSVSMPAIEQHPAHSGRAQTIAHTPSAPSPKAAKPTKVADDDIDSLLSELIQQASYENTVQSSQKRTHKAR